MTLISKTSILALSTALALSACGEEKAYEAAQETVGTDYSVVTPTKASPEELPTWVIPNVPESAEAYYGPDSYHIIAQTQDPMALRPSHDRAAGGALTWIFTDDGKKKWQVNDHGQDACSYITPDGKHVVYTSTRDNMDMPIGNWSDDSEYPQGAELYYADLDGSNVVRLTNNPYYDAEVSVSPDGTKVVFGRQIDGMMDLWMMNIDGTGERQITFTPDEQEGAPFFLPDNKTISTRWWKQSEKGQGRMTKMTIATIDTDTGAVTEHTDGDWMHWAPFPTPDGEHYVYVEPLADNPRNWEVFMGKMGGDDSDRIRLTFNDSFDGFPSVSPDGTKLLFTRSMGQGFMSDLFTMVMDISSLNVGPKD